MDPCSECGNHGLSPRTYDGVTVLECDLCGALSGGEAAVARAQATQAAARTGADPGLFALGAALDRLDGLRVVAHGGERGRRALPSLSLMLLDARGLVQLENLAKWLQLAGRSLGLRWGIEVEYDRALSFRLAPRIAAPVPGPAELATAAADVDALHRALQRDVRLSWWRHPGEVG
ncbi:MAG: hypothetical protein AB7O97_11260 [Planctomycetota bacterium]